MKNLKKTSTSDLVTDTPTNETVTIASATNTKHPFQQQHYQPGNSVDQHKDLEDANLFIAKGEIGQQMENN